MTPGRQVLALLQQRFPFLGSLPGEVWVVGGAVRDGLRGVAPVDLDLAARDPVSCASEIGRRTQRSFTRVGRHELAALRLATPSGICDVMPVIGGSMADDLTRRDFTINAMAIDCRTGELLDPFGGREDLQRKVVRVVRDSNLDDDPLRMLKGIRVAMRLGFEIEPRTLAAIRNRAPKLAAVAAERVSDELLAIFSQPLLGRAVALLSATGLDAVLFGRRMEDPVVASSFAQVGASGYDEAVIAFALLFRDPRNPPRPFAERWRWSRALRADVETVIKYAARLIGGSDIATTLYYAGAAAAPRLVWFLRAGNQLELSARVEDLLRDRGQAIFGVQALLGGDEIAEIARIPAGPQIGRLKRLMIERQLKGQLRTRQEAEEFVRRSMKA